MIQELDEVVSPISSAFTTAWSHHAKESRLGKHSKGWWSEECSDALSRYQWTQDLEDWKQYRRVMRGTKREFFEDHIHEVAFENQRPWDLMAWTKQHNLPSHEVISFRGSPCTGLEDLWAALDRSYNAASDRPVDMSFLDPLAPTPIREWAAFSSLELREALSVCSSHSAPGPDPKPGKPSYSTPKSFWPIVLLNTLGKLVEKMLACWLQFDGVAHGAFESMQFRGVAQRSTEDTGAYLTHLVCVGWAMGHQTNIVAFDIAQFFLSLNHEVLLQIISLLGFPVVVGNFFRSYLVGQRTTYKWDSFMSGSYTADVGVGQGSALSPVASALVLESPVWSRFLPSSRENWDQNQF
jgi:hypothetical protein